MSSHPTAALEFVAGLVLEDGRRWGAAAVPAQWADMIAVLTEDAEERHHFLTRPRGGAKTGDLAAAVMAMLLEQFSAGDKAIAVAADTRQAAILIEAIAGFAGRTPGLASVFRVESQRVVCRTTGAWVEVIPADGPSAFGLRNVRAIVCDEFSEWRETPGTDVLWAAIASTVVKRKGCRLIIITMAGDPAHRAGKIREKALDNPRWRVSEMPGPVPWHDPAELEEQRMLLPDSLFARYHLAEWTVGEDRLVDADDLAAAVKLEGPLLWDPRWRYVIGGDLGVVNDRTVVSVCHAEPQKARWLHGRQYPSLPKVVLDRQRTWTPSKKQPVQIDDVERYLEQASREFGWAPIVLDPWQMIGVAQRLRERRLTVVEFTFSQVSKSHLTQSLRQLLSTRSIELPDDEALLDELAHVRLKETTPGVPVLWHEPARHDDRVISLALAAHELLNPSPQALRPRPVASGEHRWARPIGYR